MDLGAFSVSLAVQDMAASRDFYGKLGFEMVGGDGESWTIMANRSQPTGPPVVIGLFHGMFESNILTFNPGWVGVGEAADGFTDIRDLSSHLQELGVEVGNDTTGETPEGPASLTLVDPDGNAILIDQHR
jgi:catechol 2,3-dioxygenase-like lactoylglutathione lyase family enzyme